MHEHDLKRTRYLAYDGKTKTFFNFVYSSIAALNGYH